MRSAPPPTEQYLAKANEEPEVRQPYNRVLVVLDLNGTLIHRPDRKHPTSMIARPYLNEFLTFLFEKFHVMVWSSAKPQNVKVLVENALNEDFQEKLVALWARDMFRLPKRDYDLNVQVYKNLDFIWEDAKIQQYVSDNDLPGGFGQHNTILIDDSLLKANAQPYNLVHVPEFTATSEQMKSDFLKEVAGYLQFARLQSNISAFIRETPFKADGTWKYEWQPATFAGGIVSEDSASDGGVIIDMTDNDFVEDGKAGYEESGDSRTDEGGRAREDKVGDKSIQNLAGATDSLRIGK